MFSEHLSNERIPGEFLARGWGKGGVEVIAALFVSHAGPYAELEGIQFWDITRDARNYVGPYPVIAHPPCERWGRYWSGGPSAHGKFKKGDDNGCFAFALKSVREFGGVLEHPEASHAFEHFGLPRPDWHGGWTPLDGFGGRSCCVAQGNYGHRARKMTWLYAVGTEYPELKWGPTPPMFRMDMGYHSAEERRSAIKTGVGKLLSHNQRIATPIPFRDLLIQLARSVK
jgi:hypothetical protein